MSDANTATRDDTSVPPTATRPRYVTTFRSFDVVPVWTPPLDDHGAQPENLTDVVRAINYKITATLDGATASAIGTAVLPWPEVAPVDGRDPLAQPPVTTDPAVVPQPLELTAQQKADGFTTNAGGELVDPKGNIVGDRSQSLADAQAAPPAPFVPFSKITREWAEAMVKEFGGDDLDAVHEKLDAGLSAEVQPHIVSKPAPFSPA
jgi:hypothetical protein